MSDVLTPEQRSRNMAAIRGKNTRPELIVRRMVHRFGYRYRLHVRTLPGNPDLVFPRLRKVILVHGCFWHMHSCRYGRVTPRTNMSFWKTKREQNVRRDREVAVKLRQMGWRVLIVWECRTRNTDLLRKIILQFLSA